MSKIILLSLWLSSIFLVLLYPNETFAQNCQIEQEPPNLIQNIPPLSETVPEDQRWFKFRIVVSDRTATYKVVFQEGTAGIGAVERDNLVPDQQTGLLRQPSNADLPGLQYQTGSSLFTPTTHNFYVERKGTPGHYCDGSYTIQRDISGGIQTCNLTFTPATPDETQEITFTGTILPQGNYGFIITGKTLQRITVDSNGAITPFNLGRLNPGTYELTIQKQQFVIGTNQPSYIATNCKESIVVGPAGQPGSITPIGVPGPGGTPAQPAPAGSPAAAGGIPCDPGNTANPGIQTAIGCIHTSPVALVKDFLKFGLGIGGGLAFLMMLLGAFQMLTSAGNPDTLAAGKDRLTNAVIGLLFVIFAVLLLQIIGAGILDIPGFKP